VAKEMTGQVEIVPGVVGPERIVADNLSIPDIRTGTVDVRIDIRFDRELRRYICHELTVYRSVVGQPSGPVTTEILRQQVQIEQMIRINVLVNYPDRPPTMRELDNPDGREPWGYTVPDGLTDHGPTDRVLRWVAHFYRLGYATSFGATKSVQESLKVPRSTAGRWISMARQKGYLGPAEGQGKAGG